MILQFFFFTFLPKKINADVYVKHFAGTSERSVEWRDFICPTDSRSRSSQGTLTEVEASVHLSSSLR